jgi:hypothetical protein
MDPKDGIAAQVQILKFDGLQGFSWMAPAAIVMAILLGINCVGFAVLYGERLSDKAAIDDASHKADQAISDANAANALSIRTQRQADLANWTMMNLEGLMVQNHINVPQILAPNNSPKEGKPK